jgi:predicted helicase
MFQNYFNEIQKQYLADSESSEHTFRTPLQNFLKSFEDTYIKRKLLIKHEPTKQEDKGRPDFKVTTKEQLTIGLIETKKINEDLSKNLNSKQLQNYKQLSENIIITDYLHFILIKEGTPILSVYLFDEFQLQNKRFKLELSRIEELARLLTQFLESEPDTIYKTKDLALKLSEKAKFLREYCYEELEKEKDDTNLLHGLFEAFKDTLLPLLDKKYFSDIYAQTLTYGLFLSALNCRDTKAELNKKSADDYLPDTFPLIKELFHQLERFPSEIVWSIDEIISILKVTDFSAIKKEFADYRHKEQSFNDPFIFFYEDFLKHYDKSQRELRGVYYTPEPAVSFIVRSIEIILKEIFGIQDGFISNLVTLLDIATGTGTFLLYSLKLAIEQAQKIGDKHTVNKILNEQIIDNFFGFELLVAPYVIAHLKISEYLKEQGLSINSGKRLNIFLTNTLTNSEPHSFPIMPNLSKEGKEANRIKNKDILVLMGNPPYSGHSANKGDWIQEEMKEYYRVDGKPLGEKNPKWLQDDYVKFIRFSQWKMEKVERGVVGIITNHSYLDNPTFRGMRQSLMKTFDEIYILDLHGNSKKKEKSPDGGKDENVFDIQQGVAIALFIKKDNKKKDCKVFQFDLFGVRESKYSSLLDLNIKNVKWNQTNPNSPFYLFKMRNEDLLEKYNKGLSLKEIFKKSSVGIVTARDEFTIKNSEKEVWACIQEFLKLSDEEARKRFNLGEDARDWKVSFARKDLINSGPEKKNIIKIAYRPFDIRYTYYTGNSRGFHCMPRKDIMINMQEKNMALCVGRQWSSVGSDQFDVVLISKNIVDFNIFRRGGENLFPLYILSNGEDKVFFGVKEPEIEYNSGNKTKGGLTKTENFTPEFRRFINSKYYKIYTPEQILSYIYAVLHSPAYRSKYIEFLKIDFPRIPFTNDEKIFNDLSEIGMNLIDAHLLKEIPNEIQCQSLGSDNNFKVEVVRYEKNKVWYNKDRYIDSIPENVWNFHIGGYQVLDKWFKERKKHDITLSGADIQHLIDVVNVLDYTIKTMHKIDELTEEWI